MIEKAFFLIAVLESFPEVSQSDLLGIFYALQMEEVPDFIGVGARFRQRPPKKRPAGVYLFLGVLAFSIGLAEVSAKNNT
jgi:hypothetical protein